MRDLNRFREEIEDMIMEQVATSEDLAYCNNCPDLRYCNDTGTYDCPAGLDCTSCEYNCAVEVSEVCDMLMQEIETCMP